MERILKILSFNFLILIPSLFFIIYKYKPPYIFASCKIIIYFMRFIS